MGRPSRYTSDSRVYDFVTKVPYSSKYAKPDVLRTIAHAVQDRAHNLEDFAKTLNGLQSHLNGTFDSFVDNLYALAQKPFKDGRWLIEPHRVVWRLSQEYAAGRHSQTMEDLLGEGKIDPQRIWTILRGIRDNQFQHESNGGSYTGSTSTREGCIRARARGSQFCSERMKIRPRYS